MKRCFFSVEPRVVFTTRQLVPTTKKDVLLFHDHSNLIYQFLCHCDSRLVSCVSLLVEDWIQHHVTKSIFNSLAALRFEIFLTLVRSTNLHQGKSSNQLLATLNALVLTIATYFLFLPKCRSFFLSRLLKELLSNL